MLQNLTDKYNDLIAQGKGEEAAFNIAVASIGDVDSLIAGLSGNTQSAEDVQSRKRNALFTAIAVALYITSPVPVLILDNTVGIVLLFVFVALATGLLIYNGVTREKYVKADDTMVEEFKEWKQNNRHKDQAANAVTGSLWLIAVCVYMLVSFSTGAWHITWIIFLITAAISSIIKGIFLLKK